MMKESSGTAMKFLLVEDNKDLANAIVSRMEMSGHVIDHA
jgi:two-component system response regulator TctD